MLPISQVAIYKYTGSIIVKMEQYLIHSCSGILLSKLVSCVAQLFPLNPGNLSFSGQAFGPQASSVYQVTQAKAVMHPKKTLPR